MKTSFFSLLVLLFFSSSVFSQGNVVIETVVQDFVTQKFVIKCPGCNGQPPFEVDFDQITNITEQQMMELFQLVGAYESKHGVQITSKTTVRDFVTESDRIESRTEGPLDEIGQKLCNFLKRLMEQQPKAATANTPQGQHPFLGENPNKFVIKSRSANHGEEMGIWIHCPSCGNQPPFVFTHHELEKLDERKMQRLFQMIEKIERQNGAYVKSATIVEDFRTKSDVVETTSYGDCQDPLVRELCQFLKNCMR